jgi:serine/threonine protein kinase
LNPGNILVTPDERVVLIDFGLAQFPGSDTMTSVDEAVGAAAYRPPECRAHSVTPVDIRSDLYSAGKLLWSMVVNELAFEGESRVFSDLSLASKLPDCQAAWHLFHIFEKTIRHDQDDRFSKPVDAIRAAQKARDLIVTNAPPLEVLYQGKCKTCRIGNLVPADDQVPYAKLGEHRSINAPPSILAWSCPVCGQFELTRREVLDQTIRRRATLK